MPPAPPRLLLLLLLLAPSLLVRQCRRLRRRKLPLSLLLLLRPSTVGSPHCGFDLLVRRRGVRGGGGASGGLYAASPSQLLLPLLLLLLLLLHAGELGGLDRREKLLCERLGRRRRVPAWLAWPPRRRLYLNMFVSTMLTTTYGARLCACRARWCTPSSPACRARELAWARRQASRASAGATASERG